MSGLLFEWSPAKAESNWRKHRVTFREAMTVFADPASRTIADPDRSFEEERCIKIGRARSKRLLVVIHTDREERVRIISARPANKSERKQYENRSEETY